MSEGLNGYVSLITGGSSGLGFEMAKQLLSQGASVIIAARGGKKLDNAKEMLSAFGDVHAVAMDVTDEGSVSTAADWVNTNFDHLDMVVCNAGIGRNAPGMETVPDKHQFFDIPVSTFKAVIDTNFVGYFIVAQKFVPIMLKKRHGRILRFLYLIQQLLLSLIYKNAKFSGRLLPS